MASATIASRLIAVVVEMRETLIEFMLAGVLELVRYVLAIIVTIKHCQKQSNAEHVFSNIGVSS